MAVTVKGFQGTISDADMATQLGAHHAATVRGDTELQVTAGSNRQLSIAAGTSDQAFVKYVSDAAQVLQLTAPSSGGKWVLVAVNRQWSPTNSAVLEAVDTGSVTDGTVPVIPSKDSLNAANAILRKSPGTAGSTTAYGAHHALALVHVRAADTTLTVFDLRARSTGGGNLTFFTLYGLMFAVLSEALRRGAVASVDRHALAGGGTHVSSQWIRQSTGQYVTVPTSDIQVDDSTRAQSGDAARNNIRDLFYTALQNGIGPGLYGITDSSTGRTDRWGGPSGWKPYQWLAVPESEWNAGGQNGATQDTNGGRFELSIIAGVVVWQYNFYKASGLGTNTAYGNLKAGWRPDNEIPHSANSYASGSVAPASMTLQTNGNLVLIGGGPGSPQALRGQVEFRPIAV